jgi:hypothetical protein
VTRDGQGEHCANSSRLHHRTESLSKVHTRSLSETTKDPMRLVPLERPIRLEFVLEDPLASDNIRPRRSRHEIPGVVCQKSTVFLFHSRSPIGIGQSTTEGLCYRRQRHNMEHNRHPEPALRTHCHVVLIDHWLYSNITLGQRRSRRGDLWRRSRGKRLPVRVVLGEETCRSKRREPKWRATGRRCYRGHRGRVKH